MAKLIVIEGPDAGIEHDIGPGDGRAVLVAGRDPRNEIPLSDNAVSRKHFQVESSPRGWRLLDLGSRNQTFLNGEAARERFLSNGDVIRAGDTEMRFECPGEPLETGGVASTILKELQLEEPGDTILKRLLVLERSVERTEEPAEALGRVRKLVEVYGSMASTTSAPELFDRLLSEIVPALGARRGAVVILEDGRWVLRASRFPAGGEGSAPLPEGIFEKAAREGKAVLSTNTSASGDGGGSTTALAAPIFVRGKAAGVLYADRDAARPFLEEDLRLLAAAADPAGVLLEKIEMEEDLRRENRNLFRSIAETRRIVGKSRATEEILEFIRRAAPTPMTVLILGETGTGKELVASAIHYGSPRRGRPFVAINCAALPENLVESELFGHERGAFTGAVTRRKGRFELADTGTVLLDEVGELSLACQAKLLRLIEERCFERVGGAESVRVDVRIIAATNRDLVRAVGEGTFREDLYYRLGVLNVRIPPLRDRPDDIPLLAAHFLEACAGGVKRLGKAAEKKLLAYSWPGNVRQLRNVIESAVVLGDGPEIRAEDLILLEPGAKDLTQGAGQWEPIRLQELEKLHILRVLEHTGGNKKKAAEMLGIERCTLYAKLKSYGEEVGN